MKAVNVFSVNEIVNSAMTTRTEIRPGVWKPSRPMGMTGLVWRLRCAWFAFTGQYDLVRWPEDEAVAGETRSEG